MGVLGSLRSRRAGCSSHWGRPAQTSRPQWRQRRMRRMSGTWACSARCDRGAPAAPGAAHTGAARRRPAARRGGSGCRIARAVLGCHCSDRSARSGRDAVRCAWWLVRPKLGATGADPPPSVATAAAVASHERHVGVLCSLRSLRAGCCPHWGRPAQTRRQRPAEVAAAVASHERHVGVHGCGHGSLRSRRAECGPH